VEATDQSITIESAVEALLAPEPETAEVESTEPEVDKVEEAEAEEEEAEVDDSEEDAEDAEADDDDEGDEYESESEEQADSVGSETFSIKVDGEHVKVSLQDLKQSYSGQRYIQQGMKQAAEQRKQAEEAYNGLNQQRSNLDQLLKQISQNGLVTQPTPPTRELLADDPLGYIEAEATYREEMGKFQAERNRLQHQGQAMQAEQAKVNKANLSQQMEQLKTLIPDFGDAKKAPKLKENLIKNGERLGFTAVDINAIVDARTMQALHESMLWRQSLEGKSDVQTKLKKARPLMKSGVKKTGESAKSTEAKLMSKLKKSGSVQDAAALLFNN